MANLNSQAIPPQEEGKQVDITETIKASGRDEAKFLFQQARNRLFDIANWSNISEGISASFILTDQYGKPKQANPAPGDHFRIDIPGPGSSSGEGYDWVRVEIVEDNSAPGSNTEWVLIKVRPSADPAKHEGIAHFLQEQASSSFVVKREGNLITAGVHGRNEKPNTETKNLADKIRNSLIGTVAVAGVATIQWQKLVKGLLKIN
jgi:protein involved in polysaccharide export with SLBB domain